MIECACQVMFPASHEDELAAVDRIPIENSMGTQYFMDVTIGEPKQKFTGACSLCHAKSAAPLRVCRRVHGAH